MNVNPAGSGVVIDTTRKPSAILEKDDFLKLMMEQLQHQDPTQPQDSSQMLAQMSQLTMVEQITNMNTTAAQQAQDVAQTKATALIGHTVTYPAADGTAVSGAVEKVSLADGKATLTVGGVSGIDPAKLMEVR
jgi:flagellar basal-body rod modification protein FlgD